MKLLLGAMGILAVLLCVVIVLLLERPPQETVLNSFAPGPLPTMALSATITPSPTPEPTPDFTGSWIASRVEKNTKKSSPYSDTVIGEDRMVLYFDEDGTVGIVFDGELALRTYVVQGDSAYVDYGVDTYDGKDYFGRTRFFFKDGLLHSVYTLDGRDASDYVVFDRADEVIVIPDEQEDEGIRG